MGLKTIRVAMPRQDPCIAALKRRKYSRRRLLKSGAVGGVGLAGMALVGCGDDDDDDDDEPSAPSGEATSAAPSGDATSDEGGNGELTTWHDLSAASGPSVSGSAVWVARDAGFLEQEGLEVELDFPGSTPRTMQLLVAGQAQSAQPDPGTIINAGSQGFEVQALWTTGAGSFFGFSVLPDSPITEWTTEQIAGTNVGISEFAGGEMPITRGALARLGLVEGEDIEFIPIGSGGAETAEAIESGRVDVFAGSYPDFTSLQARGVDLRIITPADIEAFPRNCLTVLSEDMEDPEFRENVVKYCRALSKAVVFYHHNPRAASYIGAQNAPEQIEGLTLDEVVGVFDGLLGRAASIYFDDPESPAYRRIGYKFIEDWDDYQTFLIEGAVVDEEGIRLEEPVDLEAIVNNDLIDEINDFDFDEVVQFAEAYEYPDEL
ncbi:MAG: hypothetical protein GEU28_03995 [Dehalococcoidia bacterium]|nr:hypothetical protein [Dehalococcoidia bacterium]